MNWSGCSIIEIVPDKVSGAPVVSGTRLPAQTIVDNFDAGVSEIDIAEQYDLPLAKVKVVIEFARGKHAARSA